MGRVLEISPRVLFQVSRKIIAAGSRALRNSSGATAKCNAQSEGDDQGRGGAVTLEKSTWFDFPSTSEQRQKNYMKNTLAASRAQWRHVHSLPSSPKVADHIA